MEKILQFLNFQPMHTQIREEMQQAFQRVYDSHWYIQGQELTHFEAEYAQLSETKYSVGVSNGLDALVLALRSLHIGPGDEVIVPSNTYIATALAVSHVGATPVFVEPRMETYSDNKENQGHYARSFIRSSVRNGRDNRNCESA